MRVMVLRDMHSSVKTAFRHPKGPVTVVHVASCGVTLAAGKVREKLDALLCGF
jgi:hypothetical protein